MAFQFNWRDFSPEFYHEAKKMLTSALNKDGGNKPPNLVGDITVQDLNLGKEPPRLEILEIGDLDKENFRAMFKMTYSGDGYLVLRANVQANPLATSQVVGKGPDMDMSAMDGAMELGIVAADQSLIVPMLLTISNLHLRGIIVLSVSKKSGITLVFKNDPLVSIEVHSTFDSVPSVRRNLQRDIEETLRSMFQEELPSIVHEMSVRQIRREQERQEQLRRAKISAQQAYLRNRAVSRASADAYSDVTRAAHAATRSIGSLQSAPANSYFFPYEGSEERDPSLQQAIPATAGAPEPWSLSPVAADDVWEAFGPHSRSDISSQLYTRLSLLHKQGGVDQTTTTEPNQGEARSEPGGRESVRASITATGHVAEARRAHYTTDAAINPDDNATANGGTQSRLEHRDRLVLRPTDTQVAAELASLMAMGHTLYPHTKTFTHTTFRSNINSPRESSAPLHAAFEGPNNDFSFSDGNDSVGSLSERNSAEYHDVDLQHGRQARTAPVSGATTPHKPEAIGRRRPLKRKIIRLNGSFIKK